MEIAAAFLEVAGDAGEPTATQFFFLFFFSTHKGLVSFSSLRSFECVQPLYGEGRLMSV